MQPKFNDTGPGLTILNTAIISHDIKSIYFNRCELWMIQWYSTFKNKGKYFLGIILCMICVLSWSLFMKFDPYSQTVWYIPALGFMGEQVITLEWTPR